MQEVQFASLNCIGSLVAMPKEIQFIEFFSGHANLYGAVSSGGYPSCALDICYLQDEDLTAMSMKSNPYDILTSSGLAFKPQFNLTHTSNSSRFNVLGFSQLVATLLLQHIGKPRLCIWLLLQREEDHFLTSWGIVCSSWVQTNAGTSKRSILCPQGDTSKGYIKRANTMCARTLGWRIMFFSNV